MGCEPIPPFLTYPGPQKQPVDKALLRKTTQYVAWNRCHSVPRWNILMCKNRWVILSDLPGNAPAWHEVWVLVSYFVTWKRIASPRIRRSSRHHFHLGKNSFLQPKRRCLHVLHVVNVREADSNNGRVFLGLVDYLSQWLTFNLFGDYMFDMKNQV